MEKVCGGHVEITLVVTITCHVLVSIVMQMHPSSVLSIVRHSEICITV